MRVISFSIIFLLALTVSLPWFLVALVAYLVLWSGYELFVIGIVVDSIFGGGQFSYVYTMSVGVGIVCVELIRPYMSWYDTDTSQV
jgi:hypothetical protein